MGSFLLEKPYTSYEYMQKSIKLIIIFLASPPSWISPSIKG
jgi:hypothetical protein